LLSFPGRARGSADASPAAYFREGKTSRIPGTRNIRSPRLLASISLNDLGEIVATKKVIKSAKDGEFKSKKFAGTHPATTYRQTVDTGKKAKKKK